jgi:hypothetical protein
MALVQRLRIIGRVRKFAKARVAACKRLLFMVYKLISFTELFRLLV